MNEDSKFYLGLLIVGNLIYYEVLIEGFQAKIGLLNKAFWFGSPHIPEPAIPLLKFPSVSIGSVIWDIESKLSMLYQRLWLLTLLLPHLNFFWRTYITVSFLSS